MKQFSSKKIRIDFIDINPQYKDAIVFIHGNSHSSKAYAAQMSTDLLDQYRLIFLDLPGHGESSTAPIYSLKVLAQLISDLITELDLKSFIIAGHSLGGHIAINTLSTDITPKALFLFGTPPLKNPFDPNAFIFNPNARALGQAVSTEEEVHLFMDEMNYSNKQKLHAISDYHNTDSRFRADILADVAIGKNENEVHLLKSFSGDVMFLLASRERLINNDYIRHEFFPETHFSEIDSGHSPHVERPEEFNMILSNFCRFVFYKNFFNLSQHESNQDEQRN